MIRNLPTSAARIAHDISALAGITEPDRPYTRRAFTPTFLEGRQWLARRFKAAGLDVHIDPAGNLIGKRAGKTPGLGTIMVGSHSDTVPDGGRFDGIAGVAAALEVARTLAEHNIALDHDLEIIDFLAEEVSIFGVSCVGSRAISGTRPAEWLGRQSEGRTLAEAIGEVGGTARAELTRTDIVAFLELHIEQGLVLETENLDIGVVTAIAGITRIEIALEGRADHAGTTPMGARRDALTAAARVALAIERLATGLAGGQFHFAATVGEFSMVPNAANVVPSRVAMLIDARAERRDDMEDFLARLRTELSDIAAGTGVAIAEPRVISDNMPAPCDRDVLAALDAACAATGARHRRMASGAGHDTAWMSRITRAAMIFVPCAGGRSHAPEESAEPEDIALGAAVLLDAVLRLDKDLQEKP
ncbi:Zn-dependent hydrolase [Pelagibacterium montanilacus]|uniref:Zn-dependent hydrolase n=1 Tax=Pelagibacterium montanilacus TaxID=2185280 RepID=UPI000F8D585B|nr:Zn-dependent hydrolase [Pelagibacterium montanilacus]